MLTMNNDENIGAGKTDLEKLKLINEISPSFCGAKWYNATIWLGSGMSTSCHHPPAHYVPVIDILNNPKGVHNTVEKKLDRAKMQAGERPAGCEYCWKIEDMERDAISDRVYKTQIYTNAEIEAARLMHPSEDVNLRTLEIAFDRTCNFACSYCNPAFSTTWVKDIKRNGPYKNLLSDGRNHFTHAHDDAEKFHYKEENPYVEAFFKWWETDLHRTLRELRITGGEPLMSPHTWRLMDWFEANKGESECVLALNSNLVGKNVKEFIVRTCDLPPMELYTSAESTGAASEYIRDGFIEEEWHNNLSYAFDSGNLRGLHIMCTINSLCLESLPEFLTNILRLKMKRPHPEVNFSINILRFPSFQSPLVLPEEMRTHHKEQLEEWMDTFYHNSPPDYLVSEMEANQVQRLIDYLDVVKTPHSDTFEQSKLENDFKQFYQQYDERRGKDFCATFPHLTKWYKSL
jgi:organic radical activating enzyme